MGDSVTARIGEPPAEGAKPGTQGPAQKLPDDWPLGVSIARPTCLAPTNKSLA